MQFIRREYDLKCVTDAIRRSDLPHEFATDLERGARPLRRHASVQQTQRYLNVTDEELRRGLEVSWKNQGRPLRLASGS